MQNVNGKCIFWKNKYNESTNKRKKLLTKMQQPELVLEKKGAIVSGIVSRGRVICCRYRF